MPSITTQPSPANKPTAGFTLAEVLVIAPIVILVIAGVIGFIIWITGNALSSNARNNGLYEGQLAKNRMLEDIRVSTSYEPTSFNDISSPLGADFDDTIFQLNPDLNDDTVRDTDLSAILILKVPARKGSVQDPVREIIYSNTPFSCGSEEEKNEPYYLNVIYYLRANTGTEASSFSMWRRVIHNPDQTPCASAGEISEKQSCAPDVMGTDPDVCQTQDTKVISRMSWPFFYFANSPDTTVDGSYVDCVRRCYDSPGNPGAYATNRFETYSEDGPDGINAYNYNVTFTTMEFVRGNVVTVPHGFYAGRGS